MRFVYDRRNVELKVWFAPYRLSSKEKFLRILRDIFKSQVSERCQYKMLVPDKTWAFFGKFFPETYQMSIGVFGKNYEKIWIFVIALQESILLAI